MRAILGNLGCLVVPEQVAVPGAGKAFDQEGELLDEGFRGRLESVGASVARLARRLQ